MKLHVAIPGWLGLAIALRLRQAAPSLVLSAAIANETPARPLSAAARDWLQQLFPELKTLLADMPGVKLVVARDGETIDCGDSGLTPVDDRLLNFLKDRVRSAGILAADQASEGALIVGRSAAGFERQLATQATSKHMVLRLDAKSNAHLRLYPGGAELLCSVMNHFMMKFTKWD